MFSYINLESYLMQKFLTTIFKVNSKQFPFYFKFYPTTNESKFTSAAYENRKSNSIILTYKT